MQHFNKKNMKKITILSLLISSVFISTSCDDYLDINQNPNSILYSDLNPSELMSGAQIQGVRTQSRQANVNGQYLMNAWNQNPTNFGAGVFQNPEYTLNYTSSFLAEIWDNYYVVINNYHKIANYADTSGKYDNYTAIAKIMKAYYMQYIVDLYGDCPYSQAWQGNNNTSPGYDNDVEVYKSLMLELEAACDLIDNPSANALVPTATEDMILQGSMSTWKQVAATIELKMLLRMSKNDGSFTSTMDASFIADRLTFLNSQTFFTSNLFINPGYSSSSTQQNPFYNYMPSADYIVPTGHAYKCLSNDYQSSQTIAGTTVNYPYVADPRRARLFANGTGTSRICAITQGTGSTPDVYDTNSTAAVKPAKLGLSVYAPLGNTAGNAANCYIITEAECYLLLSEAKLKGYISGGTAGAQADFTTAIDKSMAFLKVASASQIATYKTAIDSKPYFGWTGSTTMEQKIGAIMYQKWVALMGFHGIESYIEYSRTGYPFTPLSTTANQTRKPYRLLYPKSEILYNTDNVPSLDLSEITTINSKSPFWLQ